MNTHTPGPWGVRGGNVIESPSGVIVAKAWMTDDCEECANARLIATAPELLEALRECITSEGAACFGDMDRHPEWMQRRLYTISDIARSAIAKAEGRAE